MKKAILIIFSLFLVLFISLSVQSNSPQTIPNMPVGESSGSIINIGGTYLNVTWEHVNNNQLTTQEFILKVSQLENSSTASSTYTISPSLYLLDSNFNLSDLPSDSIETTAYQYSPSVSYYYNYTKTINCINLSNSNIPAFEVYDAYHPVYVLYKVGDQVSYNGKYYECKQQIYNYNGVPTALTQYWKEIIITSTNETNSTDTTWNYPECSIEGNSIINKNIPFLEGSQCTEVNVTCSLFNITTYNPVQIGSSSLNSTESMFKGSVNVQHEDGTETQISNMSMYQLVVPAYTGNENGIKYFHIKIKNIPIDRTNGISSTGTFIADIGGNLVWDKTHSSWWNDTFTRKREVKILETSGSTLTDYQVKLNISYDADMQTDFDDLRFLNSTEDGLLNYWIESYVASTYAIVWVKVPSLTASSNTSIYMYYGNAGVGNNSNGQNVFPFFDDFNDGSLNASKWTSYVTGTNANIQETGGELVISRGTELVTQAYVYSSYTLTTNKVLYTKSKSDLEGVGSHSFIYIGFSQIPSDFFNLGNVPRAGLRTYNGYTNHFETHRQTTTVNTAINWDSSIYNIFRIDRVSTTAVNFYSNEISLFNGSTQIPTGTLPIYVGVGNQGSAYDSSQNSMFYDFIFVKDYITSEPTSITLDEEVPVTNQEPQVTLVSPTNGSTSTSSTITLNATITDDKKVQNVTWYLNGILNETNTSNFNGTYLKTITLPDGDYNWSILAFDNESASNQSETKYFTIEAVPLIGNLTDNFNDNSFNTTKWTQTSDNMTIEETGKNLRFTSGTDGESSGWVISDAQFKLKNSSISIELVDAGDMNVDSYDLKMIYLEKGSNQFYLQLSNLSLTPTLYSYDESTSSSVEYNSDSHRFLRIRENQGIVYWEYSSDYETWNQLRNKTIDLGNGVLDTIKITEFWTGSITETTTIIVDNINSNSTIQTNNEKFYENLLITKTIDNKGNYKRSSNLITIFNNLVNRIYSTKRILDDNLIYEDSTKENYGFFRKVTNNLLVNNIITRKLSFFKSINDSLIYNDSLSRNYHLMRLTNILLNYLENGRIGINYFNDVVCDFEGNCVERFPSTTTSSSGGGSTIIEKVLGEMDDTSLNELKIIFWIFAFFFLFVGGIVLDLLRRRKVISVKKEILFLISIFLISGFLIGLVYLRF